MKLAPYAMLALIWGLSAADVRPAVAQSALEVVGADLYGYYCASCHGPEGKGDGPMASYLTIPVPDLTTLSRRNAGRFPLGQVVDMIDGTARPAGHGGPMPVFSDVFARELDPQTDGPTAVIDQQGRILTLARFIGALQK